MELKQYCTTAMHNQRTGLLLLFLYFLYKDIYFYILQKLFSFFLSLVYQRELHELKINIFLYTYISKYISIYYKNFSFFFLSLVDQRKLHGRKITHPYRHSRNISWNIRIHTASICALVLNIKHPVTEEQIRINGYFLLRKNVMNDVDLG